MHQNLCRIPCTVLTIFAFCHFLTGLVTKAKFFLTDFMEDLGIQLSDLNFEINGHIVFGIVDNIKVHRRPSGILSLTFSSPA